MGKSNAIVLFSRLTQLDRSARDEFYSVMPWTDVDALFSTMFEDVADAALRHGSADVHVFRSPRDHADDFLGEFMKEVVIHDLEGAQFTSQLSHAMELLSAGQYSQAVIVLENNPLIDERMFTTTFRQLSHEDDCAVIGVNDAAGCYLLGLRQTDFDFFDDQGIDFALIPGDVLKHLCRREALLIPVASSYSLDLAPNLGRLRADLEHMHSGNPLLGRRSLQMFRNLDRKYRRKNGK